MPEPLGRHHPTLRRLRALRRDRAFRRGEGVLVAEGLHLVLEAAAAPDRVERIVASSKLTALAEGAALLAEIERQSLPCEWTTDERLDAVQDARSAQPVLAIVRAPRPVLLGTLLDRTREHGPLLALCGVQDPGNLGTILRTAEAAGASGCVLCGPSADPWHPRAVRASAGSILRLSWAECTPAELVAQLAESSLVAIGAEPRASVSYESCDLSRPLVLVLGAEGAGLPPSVAASLSEHIRVPMASPVESLSVAAAAAVILFEAARQRRQGISSSR